MEGGQMAPEETAAGLIGRLRAAGDPARADQVRRYLRSDLTHLGVPVPTVRRELRGLASACADHDGLIALAGRLWAEPVFEGRLAAALLLDARSDLLVPADLDLLEQRVRQAGTWALVDVLVPGPVAAIDARADATAVLDRWAADQDRWVRRSALLAHLQPLRAGGGRWDRFARYADALLEDRDFFVRKATGWVLRDTGRRRPDLVDAWLGPRTGRISGVALREAVKPRPPARRAALLAAYRRGEPAPAPPGHGAPA
jgi:3-methyladenine DNA glycosylase AlkD